MRTIQITIDERLLRALDRDGEVKKLGRSAVLRKAAFDYLRGKRRREIGEEYRRAFEKPDPELDGWTREASWPDE